MGPIAVEIDAAYAVAEVGEGGRVALARAIATDGPRRAGVAAAAAVLRIVAHVDAGLTAAIRSVTGARARAGHAREPGRARVPARAAARRVVAEVVAAVGAPIGEARRTHAGPVHADISWLAREPAAPAVASVAPDVGAGALADHLVAIATPTFRATTLLVGRARVAALSAVLVVVARDDTPLADAAVVHRSVAVVVATIGADLVVGVGPAGADAQVRTLCRLDADPVVARGALAPLRARTATDAVTLLDGHADPRRTLGGVGATLTELAPQRGGVGHTGAPRVPASESDRREGEERESSHGEGMHATYSTVELRVPPVQSTHAKVDLVALMRATWWGA